MTDFAEHTVSIRAILRDAEQCERDKLYRAAALELRELIKHAALALEIVQSKVAS